MLCIKNGEYNTKKKTQKYNKKKENNFLKLISVKRFPVSIKFALEPSFTFLLRNDSTKLFMFVN